MLFDETKFKTKKELFKFLVANKDSLIAQKKSTIKYADAVQYQPRLMLKGDAIKENNPIDLKSLSEINVLVAINTTNFMDSHKDVHQVGIWDKSLREAKFLMHLNTHRMEFENIISDGDDLKAFAKMFSWGELGLPFTGETQALVFDSIVKKKRNDFMFKQYGEGFVRNHSVGMRYVKLIMAINDEDYGAEFEAWEKYYPTVANSEVADESGYFWAVKEAKVLEGSAVPLGSNTATPTLENNKFEPLKDTQEEPLKNTHGINYDKLLEGVQKIK